MKDVYLKVVDNQLEIDGRLFKHSELREAKEYMQRKQKQVRSKYI